ncbi:RNA polymerase sigma factor [Nocardioides sp. InS609-2]|uniref:RNA polymerase sigma factor n=1 Tax=Nocardioides sp. InS609-2 TaxID=2760705 RepID=UPI0020C066AF|nr:RNA polymerase sigma factor [Nocardioides sp. InS609-2]
MPSDDRLRALTAQAVGGDAAALNELCGHLQHVVYRLALRFFSSPQDAEDVTQEILLKVVTHLSAYEGRAKVTTWVYTIASRHLLQSRRRAVEDSVRGPQAFAEWLDRNLSEIEPDVADQAQYEELCGEVRIACTYGMLLCLSRNLRITYLLGDLIGLPDTDGGAALGITPAAFRQRLARARRTMRSIIAGRCGLVRAENPCRCSRQVESSIRYGILDPGRSVWTSHPGVTGPVPATTLQRAADQLDLAEARAEVYRTDPEYLAPDAVLQRLRQACPDLLGTG